MDWIRTDDCWCSCHRGDTELAKTHILSCCHECHFCHRRIRKEVRIEDHWERCSAKQRASDRGPDQAGFFIEKPLKIGEDPVR